MIIYDFQGGPFASWDEAEEFSEQIIPPVVIGSCKEVEGFGVWKVRDV